MINLWTFDHAFPTAAVFHPASGGVEESVVDPTTGTCLTDPQVIQLANTAIKVQT